MTAHTCKVLDPNCFRCDLNADEMGVTLQGHRYTQETRETVSGDDKYRWLCACGYKGRWSKDKNSSYALWIKHLTKSDNRRI